VGADRALTFLRELERADDETAAALAELDELARASEDVRGRAAEVETASLRLPAERERIAAALADAEHEAQEWRARLVDAQAELEAAEKGGNPDRQAAARRAGVRARDALRMAERKVAAASEEERELEEREAATRREAESLGVLVRELAGSLATRPALARQAGDPGPGVAGAAEWASRARAALFVARGRLVAEREGLVRQANELGALVLGEPLTAASAAQIARRVERDRSR
jgi:chromosome segregation ATPase